MCNPASVPDELKALDQWICWREQERDGKQTKVPVDPSTSSFASVSDPATWADFETALAKVEDDSIAGVGFVFTKQDSFVGVDLDGCRDAETGEVEVWAQEIIDTLGSFTEVSPSGTGFHIFVRGKLSEGGNRSGQVECYDSARFFTVTGEHVAGTPTQIHERPVALQQVHSEYVASEPMPDGSSMGQSSRTSSLEDSVLLEKAMAAKNGPKFARLWSGDTTGYDSHSEDDMALCCLLAFWTGGDRGQLDRLFRQSGLYRAKWDESHYADGRTYGEGTVERAVGRTSEFYEPPSRAGGVVEQSAVSPGTLSTDGDGGLHARLARLEESVGVLSEESALDAQPLDDYAALIVRLELLEERYRVLETQLLHERALRRQLRCRLAVVEQNIAGGDHSWLERLVGW